VMTEYHIQPPTRRCSATGRELRAGERFFTALVETGSHFERRDYAPEAWAGPPPGAFSHWFGKVPATLEHQKPRFDDELLEDCFARLDDPLDPARINFRYVLALLLIRRKRLRFAESRHEAGQEWMVLTCPRSGQRHEIVNPRLDDDQMKQVQDEVFQVLGWN
jgi:hypothetical protein